MALWSYTIEREDGARETSLLAAGNRDAALARAERNAAAKGARLVDGPHLSDAHRGSM